MHRYAGPILLLALACSNETATGETSFSGGADGGLVDLSDAGGDVGTRAPVVDGGGSSGGEDVDPEARPSPREPVHLDEDAIGIVGLTSDAHVVYRTSSGLMAASLDNAKKTDVISAEGGTVLIRGKNVFQWTGIDWTTNLGTLTVWSEEGGAHEVGTAYYGEDAVAASLQHEAVLFLVPKAEGTVDVMIKLGSNEPVPLLEDVGRGREGTCRPSFGFAGDYAIVASCELDETGATLRRFEIEGGGNVAEIAAGIRPLWSANEAASRFFYVDEGSRAYYWEGGVATLIDRGVAWGMILPDGNTVLYTVSDQLRRSPVPFINPTPVVTNEFLVRSDWSPGYRHVLFSKELVYGGVTKRDLYLAATDAFNPAPIVLASEPEAKLSKSSFTSDGRFAVYLTGMDDTGAGVLNARSVSGVEATTLFGVDTVAAAFGSTVVYSDNRSDPTAYPITADLNIVHLGDATPILVREGIMDGRSFFVTPDLLSVVYLMPPGDDDPGLYVQALL